MPQAFDQRLQIRHRQLPPADIDPLEQRRPAHQRFSRVSGRDEQRADHVADIGAVEQGADRLGDRHVDARFRRGLAQHRRGEGAFGHRAAVGEQLGRRLGPGRAPRRARSCANSSRSRSARGRRGPTARRASRRCAPRARPKRVISAKPRAISAARAFWPSPAPSTTPQAIASTFLTAPPISAPITSVEA